MLTAPAAAGVGLVARKGQPLRIVELPTSFGLLTSTSTRIPGLISGDDLAHLDRVHGENVANPYVRVTNLQHRFDQLHSTRRWAYVILAVLGIAGVLFALWRRTPFAARLCVALAPVATAVALVLALGGAARPAVILPLLLVASVAVSALIAHERHSARWLGPAILLLFFVVLWAWPETAGFSSIGPRPEEGGRFYGVNNVVETVLLAVTLLSAAELGLLAVAPVGVFALLTVGWSRTGADGGGLIVFAVAFAVLALRLWGPLTVRRVGYALAGCVALVLAFIGADEASGGHSHVTRAFEKGPSGWLGDLGHRVHLSVDSLNRPHAAVIVTVALAALVWLAFRSPRSPALDALLAGIAVSLVVNDAPTDVAAAGAISGFVLWSFAETARYTRARAPALDRPRWNRAARGGLRWPKGRRSAPADRAGVDANADHAEAGQGERGGG